MVNNIFMDNQQLLQTLGLTDKESQIYQLLLETGKTQAGTLIKKTGLKRATVYKSLYTLEEKGLVKQEDIKKKKHFTPLSPDNLLKLSDEQFEKQERAREDLRSMLPQLTSHYILSVEKPVITTFEGVEGLKKIYEDTIKTEKPIYAVLQTAEVNEQLLEWLEDKYYTMRLKHKIEATVIVATGAWSDTYVDRRKKGFTTVKLVDSKVYPFAQEVNIYGDKIAFINYKKGEALIGIVVHHPLIAQTMKAIFDLAWKGAQV